MRKYLIPIVTCCCLLLLGVISPSALAQERTRIEIERAKVFDFDKSINGDVRRLIGDVVFRHKDARMFCDSAYMYIATNNVDAYGSVRIIQGDTLTLTGKRLHYDDELQVAEIFENVVMRDRKMTLTTEKLDYNMQTQVASYATGARIVDAENTLTSKLGTYQAHSHDLFFRHDVVLVNPRYEMKADTLRYNTRSSTAFFIGPTTIRSDSNSIYCEDGWYNTATEVSKFTRNAWLKTRTQRLAGDTIYYDRKLGVGKAFGHVTVQDSVNKVTIGGDYAEHFESVDSSFATGHALMIQQFEGDSLFLHADTLMATGTAGQPQDDGRKHMLFAYHRVRFFKSDLQGGCDSLVYDWRDSTIRLFRQPVLWSGLNQLTADSMHLQVSESRIDRIYLVNSAFIASQVDSLQSGVLDSLRFNQIRGKTMTGYFSENALERIFVEGNGQTIYYGKNKTDQAVGVNRADCSNLMIYVRKNKVEQVTLLNQPDATFYPIRELPTRELRLKGFRWLEESRPLTRDDIFRPVD